MTRIADEINTLVDSTVDGRLRSFEPVRAKRRQLVRRRYTWAAGATLVVAALVGYQLQGGDSAHKTVPAAPTPTSVTPGPQTTAALQTGGLPRLARTAWHIDGIGSNPDAYTTTGATSTPDYLFAEIRFSSDTDGTLSIGSVTSPIHFTAAQGTVAFTEETSSSRNQSSDVQAAELALEAFEGSDLTPHLEKSGTQIALVTSNGEEIHLTRLDPVGPLGRPGDKAWSVRAVRGPRGAVSVAPSLNARFRVDQSYEAQFAVGGNTALVPVTVKAGAVQLLPFTFSGNPTKPGELAVTRALEALTGPLAATRDGRTLILTSAAGASVTLVSTG